MRGLKTGSLRYTCGLEHGTLGLGLQIEDGIKTRLIILNMEQFLFQGSKKLWDNLEMLRRHQLDSWWPN